MLKFDCVLNGSIVSVNNKLNDILLYCCQISSPYLTLIFWPFLVHYYIFFVIFIFDYHLFWKITLITSVYRRDSNVTIEQVFEFGRTLLFSPQNQLNFAGNQSKLPCNENQKTILITLSLWFPCYWNFCISSA